MIILVVKGIKIRTETITLEQFLKWAGLVQTGGEAKILIQSGKVKVNGQTEKRRSHKLSTGDLIEVNGDTFAVEKNGNT
ncbi:MAG: ribosome-associated protein [Clostridia bacterium]|nr:ribosome-associated protein [Clostridia bacterium]